MKGRYRKRVSQILGTPSIEHTTLYLKRRDLGFMTGSKAAEKSCLGVGVLGVGGMRVRG